MKLKPFFYFALILTIYTSYGQEYMFTKDQQEKLKTEKLLVILEVPEKHLLEQLEPEQQQEYLQEIEDYNTHIKKIVASNWKISEYQFVSTNEIKLFEGKGLFALRFSTFPYTNKSIYRLYHKDVKNKAKINSMMSQNANVGGMEIREYPYGLSTDIYRVSTSVPLPTEASLHHLVRRLNTILESSSANLTYHSYLEEVKNNGKSLSEKTLYISSEDIDTKEKVEKFSKAYKNDLKIVSQAELESIIVTGQVHAAYMLIVPEFSPGSDELSYKFKVYDAQSSALLAASDPASATGISTASITQLKNLTSSSVPLMKKENLWDFQRQSK